MRKFFATIGMAVCAVIGFPFKVMGFVFGLLAGMFGISNIIPLIATVGVFILMVVIAVQQAFAGDSFVTTLIIGLVAAGIVSGVFALLLNVWIVVAGTLMKICSLIETAFCTVDNKLYQGYTFCKRHKTF